MASTVQKVTIILDGSMAWHDWLEVVGKITLIFRRSPIRFKNLSNLRYRSPLVSRKGAVSLVDLTDDGLKRIQQLQRAVKLELTEFELLG